MIIFGKREAKIKEYGENHHRCQYCNFLGLNIVVFKKYFHIFFIPFFPLRGKNSVIYCSKCEEQDVIPELQKEYEKATRTPFYLYSGLILTGALLIFLVSSNIRTQKQKARFVESPEVGDVYRIRKDDGNSVSYYFLRVTQIKGDTVLAYHNNLNYDHFIYKFDKRDFFDKREELVFTRLELKEMLDKGEINSVERGYGTGKGFNRIR